MIHRAAGTGVQGPLDVENVRCDVMCVREESGTSLLSAGRQIASEGRGGGGVREACVRKIETDKQGFEIVRNVSLGDEWGGSGIPSSAEGGEAGR